MKPLLVLVFIIMAGCASIAYRTVDFENLYGPASPKPRILAANEAGPAERRRISFYDDVKPILDSRCVVCHGCYDAPCQLKLGSIEGVDRGASKRLVYDFARLDPAEPTRLFVDATDTEGWRKKEFHPVLNERADTETANLDNSILAKLLQLKRLNPLPASGKLDAEFDLEFDHELQCPRVEEFDKFSREHPKWGMPYAMPGLSLKEEYTLMQWLEEGAMAEPRALLTPQAEAAVAAWESYFNGADLKRKLVSRYLFEHLFIGHIHFKGHPQDELFQWVRSKTPSGQPIAEIVTIRPYDDPGTDAFYYRLRRVSETVVDKNHFVYELSDEKMRRYDELFFEPDYAVSFLPSYAPDIAANPFRAFMELPLTSRYQFLLDDAYYFVSGFIKGPVCRGESATSSIRDHFWVFFIRPGRFDPEKVSQALAENNHILGLPGEEADEIGLFGWAKYDEFGREYLAKKNAFIDMAFAKGRGFGIDDIWQGDDGNPNAALTVFRHFNSATVLKGLAGDAPLTGWVIDYPIFERLHYLLVAGFNVYGTAGHQLASRVYMDIIRQDAEDNFLRFMPASQRRAIYDSWYRGLKGLRTADPLFNVDHESEVVYSTNDPKREFFELVRRHLGTAAGEPDTINACRGEPCANRPSSPQQRDIEQRLSELALLKGVELKAFPEMSLLRIETGEAEGDRVYTLLVNRAYSNISKILFQGSSREPELDTLTVLPSVVGSYPNFFFSLNKESLGEFVAMARAADSEDALEQFYSRFGIRRTHPDIWRHSDWFNQEHKRLNGLEAGLLDMNRYENL